MECPHCGGDVNHVIEQRLQRVERQAAELDRLTAEALPRLEPASAKPVRLVEKPDNARRAAALARIRASAAALEDHLEPQRPPRPTHLTVVPVADHPSAAGA